MSTPDKKKKKAPALLDNLLGGARRRHQVAMITEEGDWNQHESNSGMARIFVVMLLVHVVLIGSIIVYDFIGTEETQAAPAPVAAKTTAAAPQETADPAPAPAAAPQEPAALAVIAAAGEYEVQSGDSLPSIAAKHGVSEQDLIALNRLDEGKLEVSPLTVLKIPANKVADPAQVSIVKDFPPLPSADAAAPVKAVIPIEQEPPAASEFTAVTAATAGQPAMDTAPPAPAPLVPVAEAPPAPKPEPAKTAPPKPVPTPSQTAQTKPAPKPEAKPAATTGARSHVMTKGDTLYSLSRKYGVSINSIQKANNITNPNAIRAGAKLVIPAK